uniref:Uncharacterized protein n=1 Tax=Oryza nivara TaxID=4536 RepID=A0A0E0GGM8_ORYNI
MAHVKKPRAKTGASDRTAAQHGPAPSYRSLWISTQLVSVSLTSDGRIFFMKENEGKGEEQVRKQMI